MRVAPEIESPRPDAPPPHDCEFKSNPEKGACDFHDKWAAPRPDADTVMVPRSELRELQKYAQETYGTAQLPMVYIIARWLGGGTTMSRKSLFRDECQFMDNAKPCGGTWRDHELLNFEHRFVSPLDVALSDIARYPRSGCSLSAVAHVKAEVSRLRAENERLQVVVEIAQQINRMSNTLVVPDSHAMMLFANLYTALTSLEESTNG